MFDNLEEQRCEKCGLIGTLKCEKIRESINFTSDRRIGHPVKEPNTPVEGILCTACGYEEPLEPETI